MCGSPGSAATPRRSAATSPGCAGTTLLLRIARVSRACQVGQVAQVWRAGLVWPVTQIADGTVVGWARVSGWANSANTKSAISQTAFRTVAIELVPSACAPRMTRLACAICPGRQACRSSLDVRQRLSVQQVIEPHIGQLL